MVPSSTQNDKRFEESISSALNIISNSNNSN